MYRNPYIKIQPKTREPYTSVYLIRHGHPDYSQEKDLGEDNMPLSPLGRQQSRLLAKQVATLKIDKIYSSGLVRARQTAELTAKLLHKRIKTDERLNEIDWLDWHRIPYFNMSEKRRTRQLKGYQKMDQRLDRMQTQVRRVLADIFRDNKGKNVALFCHGNIIKSMLTGILNSDVIGFLSLEVYQASISKLLIDNNGFVKIAFINSIGHLRKRSEMDMFVTTLD